MFISEAYAAAEATTEAVSMNNNFINNFSTMGLLLLIFYFIIIRPQQKKIKAHTEMVNALKVGDNVLTNGGIYGKITKVEEMSVSLEVSSGVIIKVDRMSIGGVIVSEKEKADKKPAKTATEEKNKTNKNKSKKK